MADDAAILQWLGKGGRRPGYEQPLGKAVPYDQYEAMLAERDLWALPPQSTRLSFTGQETGLDIHCQSLDGLEKVIALLAFDFPVGGLWESDDTLFEPQAGQSIFLKKGIGRMRYGADVIEIGPVTFQHGMGAMRHDDAAPNHVRILISLLTPLDQKIQIRVYRGYEALPA